MPRSTRTLVAILLWIVATFLVINHVTTNAPLGDWWLALLLVIGGLLVWFFPEGSAATSADIDTHDARLTHTQDRTDAIAASASTGDATLQDPVENISSDPAATLEEAEELYGSPGASIGHDEPEIVPASTPVATPVPTPAPTPAPVPMASTEAVDAMEPDEEVMTEERSDAIAAQVEPTFEEQAGAVENINTDPAATLEEAGEISGPPSASVSHEETSQPEPTEPTPEPAEPVIESTDEEEEIETEFEEHAHVTAEGEIVGTVNVTGNRESTIREDESRVDPEVVEEIEPDDAVESTTVEEKVATEVMAGTAAPLDPNVGEDDDQIPSNLEIDPQPAEAEDRIPDDLKRIEGIGPKMSLALITAGIDTFARLSQASEADIRAAIDAAGMRFAPSAPTWPIQAQYAATGDWEGLAAYQSTLSAGRNRTSE